MANEECETEALSIQKSCHQQNEWLVIGWYSYLKTYKCCYISIIIAISRDRKSFVESERVMLLCGVQQQTTCHSNLASMTSPPRRRTVAGTSLLCCLLFLTFLSEWALILFSCHSSAARWRWRRAPAAPLAHARLCLWPIQVLLSLSLGDKINLEKKLALALLLSRGRAAAARARTRRWSLH